VRTVPHRAPRLPAPRGPPGPRLHRVPLSISDRVRARAANPGLAGARAANSYVSWRAAQARNGGDHNLVIALGWSKGLSTESTSATGLARIDQAGGFARVEVDGLDAARAWDVWLVQNVEGPGRSALPEPGDRMHRLGRLIPDGRRAALDARFDPRLFDDFHVDVVTVTRAGVRPDAGALLYGSPMLFQRLYAQEKRQPRPTPLAHTASLLGLGAQPAFADTIFNSMDPMIARGAQIFFNEKFGGNGRTCSTCHPAENNFTIDPKFIATLPANSPLFVGENDPNLGSRFEKFQLLRELGLVVENADGFEDLNNKYVLRAVPHLLGLSRYLKAGNQPTPSSQRTGWGGDGAPGSGTLREFATGAVLQHLCRRG